MGLRRFEPQIHRLWNMCTNHLANWPEHIINGAWQDCQCHSSKQILLTYMLIITKPVSVSVAIYQCMQTPTHAQAQTQDMRNFL